METFQHVYVSVSSRGKKKIPLSTDNVRIEENVYEAFDKYQALQNWQF